MTVVLYAGSARSSESAPGRVTRHSFSFGPHYDPANLGFGPMVCHNDDHLSAGAGYPDHPHTDLEIVTWVLEGALVHTDPTGARHVLEAGRAQALSAGSGIRHSEIADTASGPCRFVQVWLTPAEPGLPPAHAIGEAPAPGGGLVEVAGGHALPIRTPSARLLVARLGVGDAVDLPDSPLQHVFVATGSVAVDGVDLEPGDAVRIVGDPGRRATAAEAAELLVWSFSR